MCLPIERVPAFHLLVKPYTFFNESITTFFDDEKAIEEDLAHAYLAVSHQSHVALVDHRNLKEGLVVLIIDQMLSRVFDSL